MAHLVRRPVCSAIGVRSICRLDHQRLFQTTSRLAFGRQLEPQQPSQPAEKSFRVASKEAAQIPADIGLLPGTFVAPTRKNLPPFSRPLDILRLQYARLRTKCLDLFQLLVYKYMVTPRPRLRLTQTAPTAVALHRQMYGALAEGDVRTLERICAEGLLETLRARVNARRAAGETLRWELRGGGGSSSRARVVSNRGARLPLDGAGIRQCVVRIASVQRLSRYRRDGALVEGSGKERRVVEYVVIQKMTVNGREGPWMVWGTTEETTLEKVRMEQEAME